MTKTEDDLSILTERKLGGLKVQPVADKLVAINLLVYGESGVGKTVLAGSAAAVPAMSPVLFVDVEGGTFSIRDKYPSVDVVRVQTWREMQSLYDELRRGNSGYATIVIDSLTEIQKFSMMQIMTQLAKEDPDRDPDIPGMREWGKSIEQIRKFVRAFRDLPCHTIFTALAASDKDQKTGAVKTKPSLPGKLAGEVAGFVDVVVYYYRKSVDGEIKRLLLTTGTEQQIAKDRSDRLPPIIDNPDMQTIYDYIMNRETSK